MIWAGRTPGELRPTATERYARPGCLRRRIQRQEPQCNVQGVGRWPNRDPLGEEDGPNEYAFVHNMPTTLLDPWGLKTCDDCKDPCGDAQKKGLDGGDAGGVICCGGKKYFCAWGGNNPDPAIQGSIKKCLLKHERDHRTDQDCPKSGGPSREPWKPGKDPAAEERHAYRIELRCLQNEQKKCKTQACRDELQRWINDRQTRVVP